MSFITALLGVQTEKAVNSMISAIVEWDPQSATEAELRTMEENLDTLGHQVAQAQLAFQKEQREADAIQSLANQRMAAAEQLQVQLNAAVDPSRQAGLQRSLATMVGLLEEMSDDVERERQDAKDAGEFLQMLQQTYDDAGRKLKDARSALQRAHRDMGRAEQQREMAERRAETARQAAGLTSATSGLTVALKAMQDAANKNLEAAEVAKAKTRLLTPTNPETEDPNIALAMARVRTTASPLAIAHQPEQTTMLSDRLRALRGQLSQS